MTILDDRIMDILRREARGAANAMTRDKLMRLLAWPGLTDRGLRDTYSRLPVCASERGLFIPQTPEELEEFRRYMKAKAVPMFERWRVVATAYPHLVPAEGKQMELF
jgi:hypothetical protein